MPPLLHLVYPKDGAHSIDHDPDSRKHLPPTCFYLTFQLDTVGRLSYFHPKYWQIGKGLSIGKEKEM